MCPSRNKQQPIAMSKVIYIFAIRKNRKAMQSKQLLLHLYNIITFAERLATKTGTFQKNRGFCAMSMLCFKYSVDLRASILGYASTS